MTSDYRPRLNVDIPAELRRELTDKVPWGLLTKIMVVILQDLVDLINKHGTGTVCGALLDRKIALEHICKLKLEAKDD